jgi:guanylate kinase
MKMLEQGDFVEAAFTHGYLYGTSIKEFKVAKNEGKIAVADIDIKGVRAYRNLSNKVKAIFLLPPSFDILIKRLISRYGKSHNQEDIIVRLNTALSELHELLNTSYYYLIINYDIAETTKQVLKIMSDSAKSEPNAKAIPLAKQLIKGIDSYIANA